ncbi:transglycosylase domain-containing protein [Paenibacillus sacheonensis]|uniref:Carboxypeptidase n=1 Tax=Paenibacillus sacheonensis TaxID=742054 RepID=A0A7X4YRF3_9BACL|nr:transglycosylase domain-containing protein [Paenibacillus sacheonensis]MBM7563548.1 penicillin-binding protein [Paenibacillus sacheonensis]NBC71153.1 carboxypeptidase [Paenibacillus sacheonensis]
MDQDHQKKPKGYSKWRTFGIVTFVTFKWLFIFGLLFGLFAGAAAAGYVASFVKDEPVRARAEIEAKIQENAITGFVYFNDGQTPVGQLRTEEDRRLIKREDIPPQVVNAVLATEDNNFYKHIGVDFNALARAVKQKLLNEDTQTGGSTLTQQLVRQVFLTLDKTDSRKAKEIFLSLRLERFMTKDEILTAYLNKVQFGTGNSGYNLYGIKAAAKGIFNITDLNQLNIAQSAYLAGLPQRPSAYTAFTSKGKFNPNGFKLAMDRQRLVLKRMLDTTRISQEQYDEALNFDVKGSLAKPTEKAYSTFPFLMLESERQAAELLLLQENPNLTPEDVKKKENAPQLEEARQHLLRGGYHIYTTIDKKVYNSMHKVGSDPNNFGGDSKEKGLEQTGAIMLDHKTGAILGMLEGRDFYTEQLNHATQMTRQPGSTMKPIAAYLPAIDKGLIQPASIIDDSPIVMKDGQKGYHIPMNVTNKFNGLVTARDALNRSLNIPALKIFNNIVTIPEAWKFARKLGITTLQPTDDAAQTGVIGGLSIGVSVEELTNAYGAIADNGNFNDAYMISRITDADGKVVYQHEAKPLRVFSEQTAFLMTDMLRTVISEPAGSGHKITTYFKNYGKIPVVGKTGSTQSYGDVWFMGFSPDITLGVWVGYEKQKYTLSKPERERARIIWSAIMNEVTTERPELFPTKQFTMPSGIVKSTVSGFSGKLPTELTRSSGKLVTDWFNSKFLPKEPDDALVKMAVISYNGVNYIPQPSTPADMIDERIVVKREKPLDVLMQEIEAAQAKLPADSRRPMSMYVPADAGKDAPSIIDPRVEDGHAPSPPSNVTLETVTATKYRISFKPSPEKDVVGYRLYRAVNDGPFTNMGSAILTGQDTKFVNFVGSQGIYAYYVTAVDVAGKESAPSLLVSPGGSYTTKGNDTGSNTGNQGTINDDTGIPEDNGTSTGTNNGLAAPSAPMNVTVSTTDIGIKLTWPDNASSEQVTTYNVYYSTSSNGRYNKIGSTGEARFEYVSPLTSGYFQVTAVNEAGESSASPSVGIQ